MRIGFIGLGIMGEAMCYNIIKKHDDNVYVYDINPQRTRLVSGFGSIPCNNLKEVARKARLIITMVPKSENALEVYTEILDELNSDKICIDMSTIEPEVSLNIYKMLKEKGTGFLDAPVVKSQKAARLGDVGIYVGGDLELYKKVKPILKYMGRSIIHMGDNGKGLVMKICHNVLVAQIQNGVNETFALALEQGIDLNKFGAAISYGGGQNYYFDSKQDALNYKDYSTKFSVENMAKDLDICHKLIESENLQMPGLEVARKVYAKALEAGNKELDFCSTIEIVQNCIQNPK